ncbi:MAG: YicC/YloC family endoribonuclease, partial [Planctomycetia bacterium]
MAISMTGCGEGFAAAGPTTCRVELRVVNNRFFKLAMRSRDAFAMLEPRIEAAIRSRVRRGAVPLPLDGAGPAVPAGRKFERGQLAGQIGCGERRPAALQQLRHPVGQPRAVFGEHGRHPLA